MKPCLNGGICVDHLAFFTCQCPPGFTGKICQTGFDHCRSDPCLNGGICTNSFQDFKCQCVDGWRGLTCDHRNRPPSVRLGPVNQVKLVPASPTSLPSNITQTTPRAKNPHSILDLPLPSTCPITEYSNCKCVISPHVALGTPGISRSARNVIAGLVGALIGLGLSLATYFLFRTCWNHWCSSGVANMNSTGQHQGDRTRKWVDGHALPPVETPQPGKRREPSHYSGSRSSKAGTVRTTNIYRATFLDDNIHSTGMKKSPDTYTSGAKDWS